MRSIDSELDIGEEGTRHKRVTQTISIHANHSLISKSKFNNLLLIKLGSLNLRDKI